MNDRRLRRDIERALLGRIEPAARQRLHDRLRRDAEARALYDRAAEALRALEHGREPADFEVDLVESWLAADGVLASAPAPVPQWRALWIVAAVLSAAALVVVLRPPAPPVEHDELVPKGDALVQPLALDVLCGPGSGAAMHAAVDGCARTDTMAFAYRVDPQWQGGDTLVLFGVDADGEALYYVPTPDAAAPSAAAGQWHALPRSVRLAVNHRSGRLRVFGLLTEAAPTLAEIDATAALLHALPPAGVGDAPWHERLAGRGAIATDCARSAACASAELELWIHEDRP